MLELYYHYTDHHENHLPIVFPTTGRQVTFPMLLSSSMAAGSTLSPSIGEQRRVGEPMRILNEVGTRGEDTWSSLVIVSTNGRAGGLKCDEWKNRSTWLMYNTAGAAHSLSNEWSIRVFLITLVELNRIEMAMDQKGVPQGACRSDIPDLRDRPNPVLRKK